MSQISIVVPVYKVENYLKRCVDSILAQTFEDFELILVDDGSPDGCPAICDEYAEKDSRVKVIHKENGGPAAARNTGLDWIFANSDSEWVGFVDSDDYVHPKMYESLLNAALSLDVNISVCSFYFNTDGNVTVSDEVSPAVCVTPEELYVNLSAFSQAPWNKLYRREVFKTIRYPVDKFCEDAFVAPKLLFSQDRLAFIDTDLVFYTHNPEGQTYSSWQPKKLDEIEVWHYQTEFMRKRGHQKAYLLAADRYIREIKRQFELVENCPQHRKYLGFMRKKMREALRNYGKVLGFNFRKEREYYKIAYPGLTKCYRRVRFIKSKLAK